MRRLISTCVPIAVVMLSWQARAAIGQPQQAQAQPAASDVKPVWQFEAGG